MSEKRYRKDYSLDGWPIADTHNQVILSNDDIVILLNEIDQKDSESPSDPAGSTVDWKEYPANDPKIPGVYLVLFDGYYMPGQETHTYHGEGLWSFHINPSHWAELPDPIGSR
ncbi:MAG: hypothetical protein AB2748_23155 [Candidatus Thiodiazotropha endolucinida]